MVEVKVDSREAAMSLRRAFVTKKKNGFDFGRLHVANSVTLGTRIRTDVMRGIANQFSVEGSVDMFISAYSSRPVLHVKETGQSGVVRSFALTYADAISKYGDELEEKHLGDAYRKIGVAFRGQLEQHFVVLKDVDVGRIQAMTPDPVRQRGGGNFRGRSRGQNFRGGRGRSSSTRVYSQGTKRPYEHTGFGNTTGSATGEPWFNSNQEGQLRGNKDGKMSNYIPIGQQNQSSLLAQNSNPQSGMSINFCEKL